MERADAARESGEHGSAAELYGRSYHALDPAAQADTTGAFVVGVAAEAHLRAFEASKDPAELDQAETLLEAFVTAATAAHGADAEGVGEANVLLARVREARDAAAPNPVPEADPELDPERPETPSADPPPRDDAIDTGAEGGADVPAETVAPRPTRDRLGLGLVVGGSLLAAGGIGITVWGSRFEPHADSALADAGFPEDNPTAAAYRDDLRTRGQIAMISGGVMMAAGVGGIIWGAVRLSRAKRGPQPTAWLVPTSRGVRLSGRF